MPDPFDTPDKTFISENIPVFAPKREQVVTAAQEWTPSVGDKVFVCTVYQGIKINPGTGAGTQFDWAPSDPIGIRPGYKYTFSVSSVILVE